MSGRFIRHNIIGSEAHRPRPIAYLSSTGRSGRRGVRRSGRLGWLVLGLVATAAALAIVLA